MSAPYNNIRYGCQVGIESNYLAAYTFGDTTAADVVLLKSNPIVNRQAEFDGNREADAPGTAGETARVAPGGFFAETTLAWQFAGPAVTYTATKFPNGHRLWRGAGLTSTFATNLHDYTPTAEGSRASLAVRLHSRGMLYDFTGAYVRELRMSVESGRVPMWEADVIGVMTNPPTQVALPTLGNYSATDQEALLVRPPKFEAGTVSLFGATPIRAQSLDFQITNVVEPRARDNSTGNHGGFSIGRRTVTASVVIEQTALATFNPRSVMDAGTLGVFTATVGATANNRFSIDTNSANTCQIVGVEDLDEGPSAMTKVDLQFFPTTPVANDGIRIRCN